MPEPLQSRMERLFGTDLSAVRIHEGPQAPAMGALAYTQGADVHFALASTIRDRSAVRSYLATSSHTLSSSAKVGSR
jgi:Domain of unknown function (DUF4157)